MATTIETNKKVSLKTAILYGLPDLFGSGGFVILGVYFMFFLTTFAGIPAWQGGLIIAIARVVDAIACLFIGPFTDGFYRYKLGQKYGRRRFFLLFLAPFTLVYILLWVVGPGFWFYLVVYIAFEVIAALIMIPWETLPSEMTTDYVQRTKLSTARMTTSAAGAFLAVFIPGRIIQFFGEHNPNSYLINGIIWSIIFVIIWLLCWKATWERPITQEMLEEAKNRKGVNLKQLCKDYWSTLKVSGFRKHLAVYLLSFTGKDFHNAAFLYFIVYSFGLTSYVGSNLLAMSVIGIPACLLAGYLMVKWGPKWLLTYSYTLMLLMLGGYWWAYSIRPDNLVMYLYIFALIYQIGRATLEFTPWNVFPFIPDLDELLTKKRREGLFAGVMTFARKSTLAIAIMALGFILEEAGFVQGQAVQSDHVLHVIAQTLVFGTGFLIFLALLVGLTFKLNIKTHAIIIKEIDRLKNGGRKEDVDPEVKKVCEALVGGKYENMWK
ncbi:MAG: MFS transporter [Alphaproteobacteria bacterium]|jgi:oligogalacturonide transporter|nr:MFS transporter [Alphaproteobacteria bacterium]